jgi:serine/threonine protein kinase
MKKHEKEADWWALGILFYEMLTGYGLALSACSPLTFCLQVLIFLIRKLPFTSPLNSEIPGLVLSGKYDLPPHLSDNARSLIKGLLTQKPSKRLGCGKKGAEEIKKHPFFAGIDWDNLMKQEPPIRIQLENEADTKYFQT